MILHTHIHTHWKRKVTGPVISLPQSYTVIDCLLRTANQKNAHPPSEMSELNFKTARNVSEVTACLVKCFLYKFAEAEFICPKGENGISLNSVGLFDMLYV